METKLGIITKIGAVVLFIVVMWWAYGECKNDPEMVELGHDIKQGWTLQEDEEIEDFHFDRLCLVIVFSFLLIFVTRSWIPTFLIWILTVICVWIWEWPCSAKEIQLVGYLILLLIFYAGTVISGFLGKITGR